MTCRMLPRAVIVPPENGGFIQECGVLDAHGAYCPRAAMWRRDKEITLPPRRKGPVAQELSGRWLWGGVLYNHFGHFQVESAARLWALPERRDGLSGVVFAAKDPRETPGLRGWQAEYLRLLIGEVPVKVVRDITRAEQLDVPGQGFGLGEIAFGTRVFRRFIDTHFAVDVAPNGPAKLFISRSKQGSSQGGFVGEDILDDRMARAGYQVFHPEMHDIETQVAHYKAARQVVALDGSALHLYAMVARGEQRAAVILRRSRGASRSLRRHMERFGGAEPLVIDALKRGRRVHGKKGLISDLDIGLIGAELAAGGFLGRKWGPLNSEEEAWIAQELATLERC